MAGGFIYHKMHEMKSFIRPADQTGMNRNRLSDEYFCEILNKLLQSKDAKFSASKIIFIQSMWSEKLSAGIGKQIKIPPDIHVPHYVLIIGRNEFTMVYR